MDQPIKNINDYDFSATIKLLGKILSHLKELEVKAEVQEELMLQFTRNQSKSIVPKKFEPIRGIYGLAEFLGVSPTTAQKLKNSGKIPYSQFERLVLFDPKKVLDALEVNNSQKKR